MKTITISLFFLVLVAFVGKFGIYILFVLALALMALYGVWLVLKKKLRYIKELKWHGARKTPIIVKAKYEGDSTIYKRAEYHRQMLKESGNLNWVKEVKNGEEVKVCIPVYELIPGYPLATNAGETWEEYQDRTREESRALLRSFHQYTYNEGRHEWVMTELLNQKKAR